MAEPWTPDETARLTDVFGTVGREELDALFPARSYRSLRARAFRLGLVTTPTESTLRARIEQGESLRQIGGALDLDPTTVRRLCTRYGIPVRSQPDATSLANRNHLPLDLFRARLDPATSWVLGMIASDGNISREGRLRVVSTDLDIVRQCQSVTGCGSVYDGSRGQHVWSYTAGGLAERLDRFGIHPAKSFTVRFPDVSDVDLPAFARGLWDGDGYWRIDRRGALAAGFGSSSQRFIETFWSHLQPVVESRARVYKHPTKEHWVIRVDRRRAERLARWMYPANGGPCCGRKRTLVAAHLGMVVGDA